MWNIGLPELVILVIVGVIVLGPERLPQFARDAGRMLRTLRDLATTSRQQLRDELGPEFADMDLRNLNPKNAIRNAVFGDEDIDFTKYDPRRYDARSAANNFIFGNEENGRAAADEPAPTVSMDKRANGSAPASNGTRAAANGSSSNGARPRPRPRPGPSTPYDADAT